MKLAQCLDSPVPSRRGGVYQYETHESTIKIWQALLHISHNSVGQIGIYFLDWSWPASLIFDTHVILEHTTTQKFVFT